MVEVSTWVRAGREGWYEWSACGSAMVDESLMHLRCMICERLQSWIAADVRLWQHRGNKKKGRKKKPLLFVSLATGVEGLIQHHFVLAIVVLRGACRIQYPDMLTSLPTG